MNWLINKNFGQSIIIVEGENDEVKLLTQIFNQLLDCNIETFIHQCGTEKFEHILIKSKNNRNDKILIFNARNSNIKFVEDKAFFDYVYKLLIENYNSKIDIDNSRVYYIFDRDPMSNNNPDLIKEMLKHLGNSYDNGDYQSGILLLSYPSIQSFLISTSIDNSFVLEFSTGKQLKKYIANSGIIADVSKQGIEHSCNEFISFISKNALYDSWKNIFSKYNENYSEFNVRVFDVEENKYSTNKLYYLFSQLLILLFDMGILDFDVI